MKRSYDLTPLAEMFSEDITPEELAATLEEVLWRYVGLLLCGADGSVPCQEDANQVYELRMLKEALAAVSWARCPG